MTQDAIIIQQRHTRFLQKVSETGIVWGLESEEGFATSSSIQYENEQGEPVDLICFWSDKALADSCAKDDWENYTPSEIPLAEFLENWCIGMANDELLVGTNFDHNLFGQESDPLELILELGKALQETNKEIVLQKFESLDDLLLQVKKVLE